MATFLGKVIIFGDKFITFMGPLSLKFGLCTLYQIHQKILAWVRPPPFLAMPGFLLLHALPKGIEHTNVDVFEENSWKYF